jgi:hypothetical protein
MNKKSSHEPSNDDSLIISRTEDGFRVYWLADPTNSHFVSGSLEAPNCSCPEFQHHEGSLAWYCDHIRAVVEQVTGRRTAPELDEVTAERLAIAEESSAANASEVSSPPSSQSQMQIKRSVSPDGRIDSLSVEFTSAVGSISAGEIKSRADATLKLQAEIVDAFLKRDVKSNLPSKTETDNNGPIPATMVSVGSSDGRWGRRLFITVRTATTTLRLYGTEKQLNQQIDAAGYAPVNLREGMVLNVPCRIVTKASEDGRWLNIERVLPAPTAQQTRRVA